MNEMAHSGRAVRSLLIGASALAAALTLAVVPGHSAQLPPETAEEVAKHLQREAEEEYQRRDYTEARIAVEKLLEFLANHDMDVPTEVLDLLERAQIEELAEQERAKQERAVHLQREAEDRFKRGDYTGADIAVEKLLEFWADHDMDVPTEVLVLQANVETALQAERERAEQAEHLFPLEVRKLRDVLGRQFSPSAVDENGWTDLHFAAVLNSPELAKVLLDAGADITAALAVRTDGFSFQHSGTARVLEKLGINHYPLQHYSGQQSLHVAAIFGSYEVASLLVAHGANINAGLSNGFTPLDYAAWNDRQAVAKLLLDRGATNWEGSLRVAVQQGAVDVVGLLIEYGADIGSIQKVELLHLAARMNRSAAVSRLLELGADVNARDMNGLRPLHTAISGMHSPSTEVAILLIERGANIHAKNESGDTPLHVAVSESSNEVTALLIECGADVHTRNNDGDSPMTIAERMDDTEILKLIRSSPTYPRFGRGYIGVVVDPSWSLNRNYPKENGLGNFIDDLLAPIDDLSRVYSGVGGGVGGGAFVLRTVEDGPAERAGMRAGDVIVSVDGKKIDTGEKLTEVLTVIAVGVTLPIEVVRDGKTLTLDVTIQDRTELNAE